MDIWRWLIAGFLYTVFTVAAVVAAGNGYRITTFAKNNQLLETIEAILWPVSIVIAAVTLFLLTVYVVILFIAAILLSLPSLKNFIQFKR